MAAKSNLITSNGAHRHLYISNIPPTTRTSLAATRAYSLILTSKDSLARCARMHTHTHTHAHPHACTHSHVRTHASPPHADLAGSFDEIPRAIPSNEPTRARRRVRCVHAGTGAGFRDAHNPSHACAGVAPARFHVVKCVKSIHQTIRARALLRIYIHPGMLEHCIR